jgi:hypothetical protein
MCSGRALGPDASAVGVARLRPGYFRGKARRIIRRSGAIAVRSLPAAPGRGMRLGVLVASAGAGGAVPLRDGRGRVVVVGWAAAGSGMWFLSQAGGRRVTGRCWDERPGRAGRRAEDGCGPGR